MWDSDQGGSGGEEEAGDEENEHQIRRDHAHLAAAGLVCKAHRLCITQL